MYFCYRAVVPYVGAVTLASFVPGSVDIAYFPSCPSTSSCATVCRIQYHIDFVYENCEEQRLVHNSAVQEDNHPPVFNFDIEVQAGDSPGT